MITEKERTIVEEVRAQKEANAARCGFDVAKIIESARLRQESSGRRIIRQGGQEDAFQQGIAEIQGGAESITPCG